MSVRSLRPAITAFIARRIPALAGMTLGGLLFVPSTLSAQQAVTNTAVMTFQTVIGADSVTSNQVQTLIVRAVATLQVNLVGAASARVGEPVQYHVAYGNASTSVPITGAALTDSLPAGLQFVSALPAPSVDGRVLHWALGDLPPGSNGEILINLVVANTVRDTIRVKNAASLSSVNADSQVSVAAEVALIGSYTGSIALTHSADLLQVGLGETAPFTLALKNTGDVAVSGVELHALIPEGTSYSRGSATGVDSVTVLGRNLTFFSNGPLAPGATRTVRYRLAVVSAATPTLLNTAHAIADGGTERSADALALVQIRAETPMQDRAVIGKVWIDANNNGVQDANETGIDGIEIWTDDGEIATTDSAGRFSFRNIRPGHHGFRLDPASVPSAFKIVDEGVDGEMQTRDASGWTTPMVNFRLVPRGARVASVRLPMSASLAAHPATDTIPRMLVLDTLPPADKVVAGSEVEVVLAPPSAGWPGEASFPLPNGWELVPTATKDVGTPNTIRDRSGAKVLFWHFKGWREMIVVRLRSASAPSSTVAEPVRVAVARKAEARTFEKSREFLDGPTVQIFAPDDGKILSTDRVYVGVRGQAGAPVALYDGDSLVAKTNLRIDGVYDFIAVPLAAGPHRLRVWMQNSWSHERWDTIAVHVTGRPAGFKLDGSTSLVADGNTIQTLRVRVLDQWGVPVVNHPPITVAATGAEPADVDADPSSVGTQLVPDDAGWLSIRLRPGHTVSKGRLKLSSGSVSQTFTMDILPASQPLLVAAVGQVGVGASADAFGSMTVRGRIDRKTSVVMSYDSRRLDAGLDAFGRTTDPLEQAQYPILGDASAQRTYSASQYQLAARVERGFDWMALGDISTAGFGHELALSGYRRALPGIAASLTTGPITWQGFGSSTSQVLRQLQVRGAGISGPYTLANNIRNGTEQVVLEFRAQEDAAHVISRQVLDRYADYSIDYASGTLLFKRPVPAVDAYGNPVFIVVLYEAESGGPKSDVWGVRAAINGNKLVKTPFMDSVRIGGTWVQESPGAGDHQLLGADVALAHLGRLELGAETSWSRSHDSAGVASRANGNLTLFGGAGGLSAMWLNVGREFGNPSNTALLGGTADVQVAAHYKGGGRQFKLAHEWQRFEAQGIERQQTTGTITQSLGSRVEFEATVASSRFDGGATFSAFQNGEFKIHWKPDTRWTFTTEARRQFNVEGANLQPDYIGAEAAYAVTKDVAINASHRQVMLPGDSGGYSVSNIGLKTRMGAGTEAYGSYQLSGVDGGRNAALVGLKNNLHLGPSWTLNALFERRVGLDRTSELDPVRTMPFLQVEEDYTSFGLGAEFMGPKSPYRLSARGEYRDGSMLSTRLLTLAGDVSLSHSLAVLSRQELLRTEQVASGVSTLRHRYSTLWGVAYRPVTSSKLNFLAKFEAIDAANPTGGGVLTGATDEGRTIIATEAIWQPARGAEFAARYAHRRTLGTLGYADGASTSILSVANFGGWRGSLHLFSMVDLRADARLLTEETSGTKRADMAPQLVLLPQKTLEVIGGYRFGDLRDPDFAVNGGPGWFVTFGAHLTEGTVASAASFWRERLAGHQQ